MVPKQLIVAVEGTAATGPFWKTIVSDYLDRIVRFFCGNEPTDQNSSAHAELSLVVFNAHGSYCACLVQRSGWTRNMDIFFQWLSAIPFAGGGFNDAAITEGLAEALMMFSSPDQGQNSVRQRHCILVAASNPYPLPSPVFHPPHQNLGKGNNIEIQPEIYLSDAETFAKFFPQNAVSLSVICPKKLPKLRGIYNAAKSNPRVEDPPADNVKNPQFLVLISENFMEACSCLSRSGLINLPSNQNPVKADVTAVPSVSGAAPVPSAASIPAPTVKTEPSTVTSVTRPAFSHISSVPQVAVPGLKTSSTTSTSQNITMIQHNENLPDVKTSANNVEPSLRPVGPAANVRILNDMAQARQVLAGGTPVLSNKISSGMVSSVPPTQTIISSGPSGPKAISGQFPVSKSGQAEQNSIPAAYISTASNIIGGSSLPMSQSLSGVHNVSVPHTVPSMSQGNILVPQMLHTEMGTNQSMRIGGGAASIPSGSEPTMPTLRMSQQGQLGMQPAVLSASSSVTNDPLNQQEQLGMQPAALSASSSVTNIPLNQQQHPKYVRFWEGSLFGQKQGEPVFITKLEGYRSASASESLSANWPTTMQIFRLISQHHMGNRHYVDRADFLVFRALNQHTFLGQLQEQKFCAVIQLPSQTLLLSVSDKANRLIGMLFPGDMVVFKPQMPNPLQQHPQEQAQMLQQQLVPQMQQQRPYQQQLVPQMQQQWLHQQQLVPQMQQQLVPRMQQQWPHQHQ